MNETTHLNLSCSFQTKQKNTNEVPAEIYFIWYLHFILAYSNLFSICALKIKLLKLKYFAISDTVIKKII